jgi:hypothetical protein
MMYFRIVPRIKMAAEIAKMIHALRVPVIHAHTKIAPPTKGEDGQTWTTAPITPKRMTAAMIRTAVRLMNGS